MIDEATFRRRFAGLDERLAQRRAAWTRFAESMQSVPVFVDLEAPIDAAAIESLQAAFARPVQVDSAALPAAR